MTERLSPANDKAQVFRSMSMADAKDKINELKKSQMENKASPTGNNTTQTSEINLHDENDVVLDGQKVKVKRTTYHNDTQTLASSVDTLDKSKTFIRAKTGTDLINPEDNSTVALLKQALESSDTLVLQQKNELKKQAKRIEELEQFISSLNLSRSMLSGFGLDNSEIKEYETPKSIATSAAHPSNSIVGGPDNPPFSSSPLLAASEDELVATHLAVDELDQPVKKMPNKLAARLALGSNGRRKLTSNVSGTDSRSATPSESVLRGRKLRTEDSDKASAASHNSSSPSMFGAASRDTSPGPKPTFEWKTRAATAVCLFIAHDNPQISKTVATQLSQKSGSLPSGSSKVSGGGGSGASGMQIMLESKGHAKSDLTHFLVGDIIYSGDYAHVQDAVLSNSRGSECLVVTNLRAVRHAVKQFKTRDSNTNKEVIEINLVDVPASSIVDVSSDSKLVDFMSNCQARVDCILDPYHSQHTWYPYYEGSSSSSAATHRKMAPQFRSQGIGYIRLGDDMSNFGVAFVSLDAGATYLDNGATSIVDSTGGENAKLYNNKSGVNLMATFPGNKSSQNGTSGLNLLASSTLQAGSLSALLTGTDGALSRKSSRLNIRNVVNSSRSGLDGSDAFPLGDEVDFVQQVFSKHVQFDAIHEMLQGLKESNLKWSQRTELLNGLQVLLADVSSSTSVQLTESKNKSVTMDLLGVLLDQLTKQKNPHVSIATLQCIGTLTYGDLLATHFAVSWRALVVETAHMLRNNNKQIFEAVVGALGGLYRARALSFAYLSGGGGGVLLDILNGPRSSGGGGSKANNPSGNGSGATLHGGSNIAKVTGWLESAAKGDLETCARHIASLESSKGSGGGSVSSSATFYSMKSAYLSTTAKLLSRLTPLLSHREEASRESVIGLCATYLVIFLQFKTPSQVEFSGVSNLLSNAADSSAEGVRDVLWRLLSDDEICGALEAIEKAAVRSFEKLMVVTVQSVSKNVLDMAVYVAEVTAAALLASNSALNSSRATSSSSAVRKTDVPVVVSPRDDRAAKAGVTSGEAKSPTAVLSRINSTVQRSRRPSSNASTASGATTVDISLSNEDSLNEDIDAHVFRTFNADADLRASPRLSPRSVQTEQSTASSVAELATAGPVVSRAMPRSSSRSKFNRGAIKQPTVSATSTENTEALGGSWFEAKLLLKRVPESDSAWMDLCEVVRSSPSFFSSLSTAASSLACPVGLVLRSVLPFDEDTSSADQAAGGSSSGIDSVNKLLTGGGVVSVSRPEMENTLFALRSQATDIRRTIRVKMADEADLKQALVAVTMLGSFVDQLEAHCMRCCSSMATVIRGLDS